MMNSNRWFYALMVLVFFINCSSSSPDVEPPVVATDRIIRFSEMDWIVRKTKDKKEGPGPNLFSDSDKNVWVDANGRLHLKIRQDGGYWYCSGITSKKSMGHGKYVFYINSDVTTLDQHVVAGLFTYLNDTEEIDIEFSKWSIPTNQNAQFASQPSDVSGNKKRFDIPAGLGQTVHSFDWQSDRILFSSDYKDAEGVLRNIQEWTYNGKDVPKQKNEKLKMNLWLFKGQMPSDLKDQEIVIDSVRFIAQ